MKLLMFLLGCALALSTVSALTAKERTAAEFAVNKLGPNYVLVKIKSVNKQIVKGTMYHVKAKVSYQIPGSIETKYHCNFKVWERPSGLKTVEESNCKEV